MSVRRTTRASSKPDEVDIQEDLNKEKHLQLAKIIKTVHADLRKKVREGEHPDKVWAEHINNSATLDVYASAMKQLAMEFWDKRKNSNEPGINDSMPKNVIKDSCRISWTRRTCLEYFNSGGLEKIRAKSCRKRKFELSQKRHIIDSDEDEMDPTPSKVSLVTPFADELSVDSVFSNVMRNPPKVGSNSSMMVCASDADTMNAIPGSVTDTPSEYSEAVYAPDLTDVEPISENTNNSQQTEISKYPVINYNKIYLPMKGKIRLLDVGSCFNPFKEFNEFISIGIDIAPAVESVYKCDFLSLRVCDSLQLAPDTMDTYLQCSLKSPVDSLPKSCFHAVVFSLLLEYLPTPTQRWQCCRKARDLLMEDGLLLIITPDSSHQMRNAPMMRSWKGAIESLGFRRCRYVKQEHLHCIAFRRTDLSIDLAESDGDTRTEDRNYAEQIYIPQDALDTNTCSPNHNDLHAGQYDGDKTMTAPTTPATPATPAAANSTAPVGAGTNVDADQSTTSLSNTLHCLPLNG